MAEEEGTQAIDRAARILVGLIESDEYVSLATIIERTGLSKSTAARLLRALERSGLAQRGPSGGFRPGRVLIEYARRETSVADLAELAAPFLERLRRDTGETANIAIPLPGGVTRLDEFESAHPLGAGNWPGVRIPLHASAMGKVFMAFGAAQPPDRPARPARAEHDHDRAGHPARARARARDGLRDDLGGARGGPLLGRRARARVARHA